MPDSWIDDMVGDELQPRRGFEDRLANDLHREWKRLGGRRWRPVVWAAAAVLLVVAGVVVYAARKDPDSLAPADTTETTTAPSTVDAATTTTGATSTTSPSTTLEPPPLTEAEQTVADYLAALGEGHWSDAAALVGQGGLELEARGDLRPLFGDGGLQPGAATHDALAAALQQWCATALCGPWDSMTTVGFDQVVTWRDGDAVRTARFTGFTFEGSPGVVGLPPQLPAGRSLGETVACPAEIEVTKQAWADLDGDGWHEIVLLSGVNDASRSLEDLTVVVCGSDLVVEPYSLGAGHNGSVLVAVNPSGQGGDLLLAGGLSPDDERLDVPTTGIVLALAGGRLEQVDGPDGPATFTFQPSIDGAPGQSAGCHATTAGHQLVGFTYQYVDGTDLSTSLRLEATFRTLVGAAEDGTISLPLPAEVDAAFEVVAGYCDGLPVLTG